MQCFHTPWGYTSVALAYQETQLLALSVLPREPRKPEALPAAPPMESVEEIIKQTGAMGREELSKALAGDLSA